MSGARPWPREWKPMADAARPALGRARGRPRRGAAIQDEKGVIHIGASLSVAELPSASLCAEQTAVAALCASGSRIAKRIVVLGPAPAGAPPPCGRCLQVLREFGKEIEIRWGTPTQERGRSNLARLLPDPFDDYR